MSTIENSREYKLSNETLFFAALNFNDTLSKIIYFENLTLKSMKILKIENACGCTSAFVSDSIVNAMDSVPIQIFYIPSKSNDSGNVLKYITIRSNAKIPFVNLIITGNIKK